MVRDKTRKIIEEKFKTAAKDHLCEGFLQIKDKRPDLLPNPHDGINKGEKYFDQTYVDPGIHHFRSCITCLDIIKEHNLFEGGEDVRKD